MIFCYFWPGAPKFKHCKLFWDPPSQKKHRSIVNHCWFWWKINVSFLNFSCQIGIHGAGITKWNKGVSRGVGVNWHKHRFPYKQIKEKNYWIPGYQYWFSLFTGGSGLHLQTSAMWTLRPKVNIVPCLSLSMKLCLTTYREVSSNQLVLSLRNDSRLTSKFSRFKSLDFRPIKIFLLITGPVIFTLLFQKCWEGPVLRWALSPIRASGPWSPSSSIVSTSCCYQCCGAGASWSGHL